MGRPKVVAMLVLVLTHRVSPDDEEDGNNNSLSEEFDFDAFEGLPGKDTDNSEEIPTSPLSQPGHEYLTSLQVRRKRFSHRMWRHQTSQRLPTPLQCMMMRRAMSRTKRMAQINRSSRTQHQYRAAVSMEQEDGP